MKSPAAGQCSGNIAKFAPIGLIFAVALGLRVLLFWADKVIAADGISYVSIARAIIDNFNFRPTSHFPPVYPILIGLFSYLAPYDEVAGKVASTIMGSLLVFPLYLLGKEIFSRKVGYIAAILAALSPSLVSISGIVLSQSTYITLLVSALYLFWKSFDSNSWKSALAAGGMFALSYLTRPEAIIVLAGISGVFLTLRPPERTMQATIRQLLYVLAGFFILAFPYILLLHDIFGGWQLTGKSSVTLADSLGWYLNRPDLKREPGFAGLSYLDIVRQYPGFLWQNPLKNLPAAWAEMPSYLWLLALLGLGATCFSARKWRNALFLGAALLPLGVIIVFFWIDGHYFAPSIPILLLAAGEGLVTLEQGVNWAVTRLGGASRFRDAVPTAMVVGTALAVMAIMPGLLADRNGEYHFDQDGARYDHKLIGLMLKKHLPPGAKVMVKSGRIAFYGGFQQVDIPQAGMPEILQAGKKDGARYLIADGTLFGARPQMQPFLDPLLVPEDKLLATAPFAATPTFPEGLRLVLLYKDPSSVGVAVYEFPP